MLFFQTSPQPGIRPVQAGQSAGLSVADDDLPDHRRLHRAHPLSARSITAFSANPGPERGHHRGAGHRHRASRSARSSACSRKSAGSTRSASPSPASRSTARRCCWRRWRRCSATASAAWRSRPRRCGRSSNSIQMRLDEDRDIGRYLTSLLIFLGLLGTFWGLLQTVGAVADTIQHSRRLLVEHRRHLRGPQGRPRRAARRHGHRLLVVAVRPRRLAGARLPRPPGRPGAEHVLQRPRGLAVDRDRPRPRAARMRGGATTAEDLRVAIERLSRTIQDGARRRRTSSAAGSASAPPPPWPISPRASRGSSSTCAASSRWSGAGSRPSPSSSARSSRCSRPSPARCRAPHRENSRWPWLAPPRRRPRRILAELRRRPDQPAAGLHLPAVDLRARPVPADAARSPARDTVLQRLNAQIAELTEMLALETRQEQRRSPTISQACRRASRRPRASATGCAACSTRRPTPRPRPATGSRR